MTFYFLQEPQTTELVLSVELSELIARSFFFLFFHGSAITFGVLLSSIRK